MKFNVLNIWRLSRHDGVNTVGEVVNVAEITSLLFVSITAIVQTSSFTGIDALRCVGIQRRKKKTLTFMFDKEMGLGCQSSVASHTQDPTLPI